MSTCNLVKIACFAARQAASQSSGEGVNITGAIPCYGSVVQAASTLERTPTSGPVRSALPGPEVTVWPCAPKFYGEVQTQRRQQVGDISGALRKETLPRPAGCGEAPRLSPGQRWSY
jgi:hypothetical protein